MKPLMMAMIAALIVCTTAQAQDQKTLETNAGPSLALPELNAHNLPLMFIELVKQPSTYNVKEFIEKRSPAQVSLEMPLYPFSRKGISAKRLAQPGTIQAGTAQDDWTGNIHYGLAPEPTLNVRSTDVWFDLSGGFLEAQNILRRIYYADGNIERAFLKYVLISADGYYEGEKAPGVVAGIFSADVLRRSYGASLGLGAKVGDLSRTFIAGHYNAGYVMSQGEEQYHPDFAPVEQFEVYKEPFLTRSATISGGIGVGLIQWRISGTRTWYQRRETSPDPARFGYNQFTSTVASTSVEIAPVPSFRNLHIVISSSADIGDKNHLIFRNDQPPVQVSLRYVFKGASQE